MKKPTQETIKKIDYIIQGLEDGRFTEISKAVEFHQKLKGDDEPTYFTDLLTELQVIRQDMLDLEARIRPLEDWQMKEKVQNIEVMLQDYTKNMRGIANALAILADPQPPLSGGLQTGATRYYNEADAEQFISGYKDRY